MQMKAVGRRRKKQQTYGSTNVSSVVRYHRTSDHTYFQSMLDFADKVIEVFEVFEVFG
jgi:hypothetical protein